MHSQFSNSFIQMEVFHEDPMDIDTDTTNTAMDIDTTTNNTNAISQEVAQLQSSIASSQNDVHYWDWEFQHAKGLWAKAQMGAIPEGFEQFATTFRNARQANTAIKAEIKKKLFDVGLKKEKSITILTQFQRQLQRLGAELKKTS